MFCAICKQDFKNSSSICEIHKEYTDLSISQFIRCDTCLNNSTISVYPFHYKCVKNIKHYSLYIFHYTCYKNQRPYLSCLNCKKELGKKEKVLIDPGIRSYQNQMKININLASLCSIKNGILLEIPHQFYKNENVIHIESENGIQYKGDILSLPIHFLSGNYNDMASKLNTNHLKLFANNMDLKEIQSIQIELNPDNLNTEYLSQNFIKPYVDIIYQYQNLYKSKDMIIKTSQINDEYAYKKILSLLLLYHHKIGFISKLPKEIFFSILFDNILMVKPHFQ